MPIYDFTGTNNLEIGKVYDQDGTASHQLARLYDFDGTASHLLYSAEALLVGEGAVPSAVTDPANWARGGRINSYTISTSELYYSGGGNASAGYLNCQVPLPTGYTDLEIAIPTASCYMGSATVSIGTTVGGSQLFRKTNTTGTFHVTLDPAENYYLRMHISNIYTPDGVIRITKLKLT